MPKIYKVTFDIDQDYGYIVFDEDSNSVDVFFPDIAVAEKIKNWLDQEHEINTPDAGGALADFSVKRYAAARSKKDFQTILTRAWERIGVHVDWSFPADYI
jgi:hypothetical protein